MKLTTRLLLVPRLRMRIAVTLHGTLLNELGMGIASPYALCR
jgi:hypothetical protein